MRFRLLFCLLLLLSSVLPVSLRCECIQGDCVDEFGVFAWPDGERYAGEWEAGMFSGMGVHIWPDGEKYVGQWQNDKKHGVGTTTWPDGESYSGGYENGLMHGQGEFCWASGAHYFGQWQNGKKHGYGIAVWPDGERYEGYWKDDMFDGQGAYTWQEGHRYTGGFFQDRFFGYGKLVLSTGLTREGYWENDVYMEGRRDPTKTASVLLASAIVCYVDKNKTQAETLSNVTQTRDTRETLTQQTNIEEVSNRLVADVSPASNDTNNNVRQPVPQKTVSQASPLPAPSSVLTDKAADAAYTALARACEDAVVLRWGEMAQNIKGLSGALNQLVSGTRTCPAEAIDIAEPQRLTTKEADVIYALHPSS